MSDKDKGKLEFPVGGQWEFVAWEVRFDVKLEEDEFSLCPHAIPVPRGSPQFDIQVRQDNGVAIDISCETQWVIPRAVIGYNEGGYCSTGICLDCILEAVPKINQASAELRFSHV